MRPSAYLETQSDNLFRKGFTVYIAYHACSATQRNPGDTHITVCNGVATSQYYFLLGMLLYASTSLDTHTTYGG